MIREGLPPNAPDAFKKAIESASKELEQVNAKIGKITITVAVAGGGEVASPKVTLDEKLLSAAGLGVGRPIDPGKHTVKVTAAGFKPLEKEFNVPEGGAIDAPME